MVEPGERSEFSRGGTDTWHSKQVPQSPVTLAGILFTELGQSICPIERLSENLAVRLSWALSTSTTLDVPNNKVNSSSSPETFFGVWGICSTIGSA